MRIVLLTNNQSLYGKILLHSCVQEKIPLHAVVVVKQPLVYFWKLFHSVKKRTSLTDAIYFSLQRILTPAPLEFQDIQKRDYQEWHSNIHFTQGNNSLETQTLLKTLKPDILVLGQTGILKSEVLSVPQKGTLNAHPGILPEYRGINCAYWALYQKDFSKIGSSVHWVDDGIDTGRVITQEKYTPNPQDSFEYLESLITYRQCVSLLTQTLSSLNENKKLPKTIQKEGSQYYKMTRKQETSAKKHYSLFLGEK
jgi:folate-dependent phosphoribosylglycinamide formyltransferase PurN